MKLSMNAFEIHMLNTRQHNFAGCRTHVAIPSVCLSVCLYVMLCYCVKMTQRAKELILITNLIL